MTSKLFRILLTVACIGGALGYMFYSTLSKDTEYYKHVDEVMNSPQDWYGKRLKLHGYVVDQSIFVNDQTLEYRFAIETNGKVVNAAYRGVVPDTFKSGAEVVVTGKLDAGGFHVAPNGVTAKCPSKYDATPNPAGTKGNGATSGGTE